VSKTFHLHPPSSHSSKHIVLAPVTQIAGVG